MSAKRTTSEHQSLAAARVNGASRERAISATHVLLGDIGATNARFALLADGALGPVKSYDVARFPRFADAAALFLKEHGENAGIGQAALAVAAPVEGERCVLTNCAWEIDTADLRRAFGFPVRLINDFEAVALSLPALRAADLKQIGGGAAEHQAPMAVLGPGSGLGVACLVGGSGKPLVVASEGGHATIAGTNAREDALIAHLRERFGHVSAERVISGAGLENIHQAIGAVDGKTVAPRSAAEITSGALNGGDAMAREALEIFCALLGAFAGNIVLTFRARGGVYVAGGITPRILDFLARSDFRPRFEAKGRFKPYLAAVPSYVIVHPAAAFVGLKSLLQSQ